LLKPLADKGYFALPDIPDYATNNAHMFYLLCNSLQERTAILRHLKENGILAVFHYLSLHASTFYAGRHDGRALPECDRYQDTLVRLPMYYDLTTEDVAYVAQTIAQFFTE
ncbi:MAG: DegT/DnrJ/EryC1/StrS family aminotransferase, partial [Paludibacteraceae bacterium]|nr:DegT/DnrJ/EryC1/StrS family aminotransferase [Paludibacteraceae bacterium]